MGAEVVVLLDRTPVAVDHRGPVTFGTDAVLPVVFVGEAAARPAEVGDGDLPQRLHDVESDALVVGDGAVVAHIEAAVDTAAQMLGEVAIEVPADHRPGDVEIDDCLDRVRHYPFTPPASSPL